MYKLIALTGLMYCMLPLSVFGQKIQLGNPSFEDEPRSSSTPSGWYDCGKPGETPPDTQPHSTFKVTTKATEGRTYLGLVTRDNDTWEAVGQMLRIPLEGEQCYNFNLYLARSEVYESATRTSPDLVQHTQPIKLRIWAGDTYCDKKELLDETDVITHSSWRKYDFKFNPRQTYRYIMLEAFYQTPTLMAYNGNLLIDKCSAIIACDKEEEEIIAEAETPRKRPGIKPPPVERDDDRIKKATTDAPGKKEPVEKVVNPPKKEPKIALNMPELENPTKITKGQTIQVNNLRFKADSATLNQKSYEVLDEIYTFLQNNDLISIEIGGHTNNIPPDYYCNKLSKNRAKVVADYLISKGIDGNRISFKGYGKTEPLVSNKTVEGRRKNQRVEIKIISTDGD